MPWAASYLLLDLCRLSHLLVSSSPSWAVVFGQLFSSLLAEAPFSSLLAPLAATPPFCFPAFLSSQLLWDCQSAVAGSAYINPLVAGLAWGTSTPWQPHISSSIDSALLSKRKISLFTVFCLQHNLSWCYVWCRKSVLLESLYTLRKWDI